MRPIAFEGRQPALAPAVSILFLAGRILISLAFMALALGQIMHFEMVLAAAKSLGLPLPGVSCVIAILLNFLGAVSLGLGFMTRMGALVLIVYLVPAMLFFRTASSGGINFAACIAVTGGLMPFLALGPGKFSFDHAKHEGKIFKTEAKRYV